MLIPNQFMFKSNLKVIWRNMSRNKIITLINIVGLALGMAVTMIIILWVWRELSFNKSFANYKSISQVMITGTFSGEISTDPVCPVPLANELKTNFSSYFKEVALTSKPESHILYSNTKLSATGTFAQKGFVDMLPLTPIKGSLKTFDDPSSILISASLANSLFGNHDPVGKLLKIDNNNILKVAAVYDDFPTTTSFNEIKYIVSWNYFIPSNDQINEEWNLSQFLIYVQLRDNVKNEDVSEKVAGILEEHAKDIKPVVILHPMEKWHLYETFQNGKNTGGQIHYVRMCGIAGLFVLLLACINFMNLSTAKSSKRAKEVGILKTIGSDRKQLMLRFLTESLITAIVAFAISLVLVKTSLRWFNDLTGNDMIIPFDKISFYIICTASVLFTAFVAGSYPALYLSSFKPIKVLKGGLKAGMGAPVLRKVLMVVQFFTSIFLIVTTLIVSKQINYARSRPIGYSVNGLISLAIKTPELLLHYSAFRNDLLASGAVVDVAASSSPANRLKLTTAGYSWQGKDPSNLAIFGTVSVTEDFAKTVQWHFKEGRSFSRDFRADSSGIILNEMALRYMGIERAIGKNIEYQGENYKILGVVEDPIMGSPFASIIPTAFFLARQPMEYITIKLSPTLITKDALRRVEAIFKHYSSEDPFDYSFIDQQYGKQFRLIETVGTLAGVFAVLAIFISSLGLYALATFIAEQRVKEIGIRKVLGASVAGLWVLITSEFLLLNIIAFILAIPPAWWIMKEWLNGYVFRTSISWSLFAITATITIAITLLTVSFHAIKAAVASPVNSLRSE